jgi:tetratricopeptide (TPR) repeat protein
LRKLRFIGLFALLLMGLAMRSGAQAELSSLDAELRSRLQAAAEAQSSGNSEIVARANRQLIAVALSYVARLRATEGLDAAAAELYRRSVEIEDRPKANTDLALIYMRLGRMDDAVRTASHATNLDPKNAAAWNLRGKLLLFRKDYAMAAEALEKSLALQADGEVSFTLATAYLNLKQMEKAQAIFQEMEKASGDDADVHIMIGRTYEGAGVPDAAEREYRKAIAADPKASRGHYFLGLFYLVKNGWEVTPQSREAFVEEVKVNPNDFFGNYFLGFIASGEKKFDESDAFLKVAAAAKPDWPEPYLYLGLNAYGRRDDLRAEQWLRKAIELTGKDEARNNYQIRRAYFTLGRILVQSGKKEEGNKYLLRSREIETNLVIKGREQQALDIAAAEGKTLSSTHSPTPTEVVDPTAPVSDEALQNSSLPAADKEKIAAVEKGLRSILASAYNDLGSAEARQRQYESALNNFQEAEKWDPNTPNLMRNLGRAAFLSKKYAESARALKTVVGQDASDQKSQSMLAMSLFSMKNYAAAVPVFDRLPEVASADPRMAYGWALSLVRTNHRQRASGVLEKLVAQPIPPAMLVLAGELYGDLGEKNKAKECFRRAKEQDPSIQVPR